MSSSNPCSKYNKKYQFPAPPNHNANVWQFATYRFLFSQTIENHFFSPIFQPPRKRLRKQQSPLVKEVTDDSFYTKEELAVSKLENHHLFFDDDVPCEANTPLEEDRECCPKCDRKFITYFR